MGCGRKIESGIVVDPKILLAMVVVVVPSRGGSNLGDVLV